MNEKEILDTILTTTYTKLDIARRMRLLREYLEHRFFQTTSFSLNDFLTSQKAEPSDFKAMNFWGVAFYDSFNRENAYLLLGTLNLAIEQLPMVTVYLSVFPSDTQTADMGMWFRKHLTQNVLMDIRINPKLVGGCSYVWNNLYHEFSLAYFFNKKRDVIAGIVSEYATRSQQPGP
jgi:hypothetical protein